jgi:hypothetical protein
MKLHANLGREVRERLVLHARHVIAQRLAGIGEAVVDPARSLIGLSEAQLGSPK